MFKYPKVSILLPTYNRENYLPIAIESALAQDYHNLNIIISDDASSDNSENIIKKFAKSDSRIKYFRNSTNMGSSKNIYKLIYEYNTSEWFFLLADDDFIVEKSYISKAISLIEKYQDIVLIHANCLWYHENRGGYVVETNKIFPEVEKGEFYFLNWKDDFYFYSWTVLCKTDIAKELNCYNGNLFSDDWKCWLKFCLKGRIGFLSDKAAAFRFHGSNYSFDTNIDNNVKGASCITEAYEYAKLLERFPTNLLDNWYRKVISIYFRMRYNALSGMDKGVADVFYQRFAMEYPFIIL